MSERPYSFIVHLLFTLSVLLSLVAVTCDQFPFDPDSTDILPRITGHSPDTSVEAHDSIRLEIFTGADNAHTYYWESTLLQKIDSTAEPAFTAVYDAVGCDTMKIWFCTRNWRVSDTAVILLSIHEWAPYFTAQQGDRIVADGDTAVIRVAAADSNSGSEYLRYVWAVDSDLFSDTTGFGVFRIVFPETGVAAVLVKVIDRKGNASAVDTIRVAAPGSAYLKSIGLSKGKLRRTGGGDDDTIFDPHSYIYEIMVHGSAEKVTMSPMAEDSLARVKINGAEWKAGSVPAMLSCGDTVKINVTSVEGMRTRLYRFVVLSDCGNESRLAGLAVYGKETGTHVFSPVFNPGTFLYRDTIYGRIDTLYIVPQAVDSNAVIMVENNILRGETDSVAVAIGAGCDTVSIKVASECGTDSTVYRLVVVRRVASGVKLAALFVSAGTLTPAFTPGEFEYYDTVADTVDSIFIRARATDSGSVLCFNGAVVQPDVPSPKVFLPIAGSCTLAVRVVLLASAIEATYRIIALRRPSSSADLKNLSVSAGTLAPRFAPETTGYVDTVAFAVDTVTVIPQVASASATVSVNDEPVMSGNGIKVGGLRVGANMIEVRVIAADGITERIYRIALFRQLEMNAELSRLEVSAGTLRPDFSPAIFEYYDTVADTVDSIAVNAMAKSGECLVSLNGGALPANVALPPAASCTLTVSVMLPDSTGEKRYRVVVLRPGSSESKLAELSSGSLTLLPAFGECVYSYSDTVPYACAAITLTTVPKHPRAVVTVNGMAVGPNGVSGPINLSRGLNTVRVKVLAENGVDTSVYGVAVFREYNNDPFLSSLTVSAGALNPPFRDSTARYTVEFAYGTTFFTTTPTARDAAAGVVVSASTLAPVAVNSGTPSPPIALTPGQWDTVKVTVSADNPTARMIYTIAVTAPLSPPVVTIPATISSSTTLSDTNVYYVADRPVAVPAGVTLTIGAGVRIRFPADTGAAIKVSGTLAVQGTESRPVEFLLRPDSTNRDTTRWGYIASDRGTLDLNYLRISRAHRFVNAGYGRVHLNHCYVESTYDRALRDCIGIRYATEVLVEYCELHGNPDRGSVDGVNCDSISAGGIIRYNSIYDFGDDAINIGTETPGCVVERNYARNCSFGLAVGENSTVTAARNIFVQCRVGALQSHSGSMVIAVNNTLYKNAKGVQCYRGNSAGTVHVRNTIFASTTGTLFDTIAGSVVTVNYSSCNTAVLNGTENLSGDPGLADPDNGNFNLTAGSACINRGDPAETGGACGGRVDIGAMEYGCGP